MIHHGVVAAKRDGLLRSMNVRRGDVTSGILVYTILVGGRLACDRPHHVRNPTSGVKARTKVRLVIGPRPLFVVRSLVRVLLRRHGTER